jgi:hypothetical protein
VTNAACLIRDRKEKKQAAKPGTVKLCIARKDYLRSLTVCIKLAAMYEEECIRAFREYLQRLERATYERQQPQRERDEMEM